MPDDQPTFSAQMREACQSIGKLLPPDVREALQKAAAAPLECLPATATPDPNSDAAFWAQVFKLAWDEELVTPLDARARRCAEVADAALASRRAAVWSARSGQPMPDIIKLLLDGGRWEISVILDGDTWCALLGPDLQSGMAGFGSSPAIALGRLAHLIEEATHA